MREIKKSYHKDFPPAKLYLDDLEEIVSIFHKVSPNVKISTDRYEFDGLDELPESGQEHLKFLELELMKPYLLSLSIGPREISFYSSEDELPARGVYNNIQSILKRRRRYFLPVSAIYILGWLLLNVAGYSLGMVIASGFSEMRSWAIISHLVGVILSVVIIVRLGYLIIAGGHTIIITRRRKDAPSFLTRNLDKIILIIITALVTAVATLLLQVLICGP